MATHFIHDSESLQRIHIGDKREEHRQDVQDTIDRKTAAKVMDFSDSPTNPMRQWGRAMSTADFERKLAPILPTFVKVFHDPRPGADLKHLYLVLPDGTKEHLLAYSDTGMMPEHTIMFTHVEDVPDLTIGTSMENAISRADLPPWEFISPEEGYKFDTSKQPLAGMKRVETVGSIAVKGWRQILLQLILLEVITPTQAERVFGTDERKEWAGKTGKQDIKTLW